MRVMRKMRYNSSWKPFVNTKSNNIKFCYKMF